MVPTVEHTTQVSRVQVELLGCPKMSELVKGMASCHKTLLQIYKWQSYPKASSQFFTSYIVLGEGPTELPGEGPTDVEDAAAPAC